MVNISNSQSKLYALLIGINHYETNPYYQNLMGAVRDIDLLYEYLTKTLQIPPNQVKRLISDEKETLNLRDINSEEILPTYENIVKAFNEVTEQAKEGDLVYIHYSGHGGCAKTIFPEIKPEQQDECIVPSDIGESGRYLRDVEITTLLKRMTDKGLVVFVVFDSCHSGGATRGDYTIRGGEQTDNNDRTQTSLVAEKGELIKNWKQLTSGNTMEGWLPHRDYVFLAACRPSEFAYEYTIQGRERHGALTYWMIDTLRNSSSELTYQMLYNRVKGMIQSKFPNQLPMLLGESSRLVFGDKTSSTPYTVNLIKVNQQQTEVTLDAGAAQGLSVGTRFAIYPLNTQDFADKKQVLAVVEITKILGSSSVAQVLIPKDGGIKVKGKLEPGLPALILAAPINLIRRVRFYKKEEGDLEHQLPPKLMLKQDTALEEVHQALANNGWVVEVQEGEESDYQVAVGRGGEYEICIGMPLKNLHPSLNIDDKNAPETVVKRLIHLAKYQATAELDNPNSPLEKYLEFELLDQNEQPFPNPNNIVLKSGKVVCLLFKNNYSHSLNIAILDLEPTWGISQIDIQEIDAPFYELASGETLVLENVEFESPSGDSYEQGKETLKIFAVRGLANFKWLTLPPLDEEQQSRGNLNQELKNKKDELITRGITRGEELTVNPLNSLLATIGAEIDEPPKITRAFRRKPNSNAEWVTKQIQVTVKTA